MKFILFYNIVLFRGNVIFMETSKEKLGIIKQLYLVKNYK